MGYTKIGVADLWKEYERSRSIDTRNELILQYISLANMQAARVAKKLPAHLDFDELCCAAYDGLMEAVESYDTIHGAKFETFCQQRIYGAIMDYIRTTDDKSRLARNRAKIYERYTDDAMQQQVCNNDPRPIDEIIMSRKGISSRELELLKQGTLEARNNVSLESLESARMVEEGRCSRGIDARLEPGYTQPISREDFEYVAALINHYPDKIAVAAATMYVLEGLSMQQVGVVLDLSESRVSQVLSDVAWCIVENMAKGHGEIPDHWFGMAGVEFGDRDGLYNSCRKSAGLRGIRELFLTYKRDVPEEEPSSSAKHKGNGGLSHLQSLLSQKNKERGIVSGEIVSSDMQSKTVGRRRRKSQKVQV